MSDRFENSWQNHSVEYIDNQISENKLEFVVINDPELDFELVQEAWMNEKYLVAVAHKIDGEWRVTFIPYGEFCQLFWQALVAIYQSFSKFVSEQTQSSVQAESGYSF